MTNPKPYTYVKAADPEAYRRVVDISHLVSCCTTESRDRIAAQVEVSTMELVARILSQGRNCAPIATVEADERSRITMIATPKLDGIAVLAKNVLGDVLNNLIPELAQRLNVDQGLVEAAYAELLPGFSSLKASDVVDVQVQRPTED